MKKNQVKGTKSAKDVFAFLHTLPQEVSAISNLRTKGDFAIIRDVYGICQGEVWKTAKGWVVWYGRKDLFTGGFSNRKGFKTMGEVLEFANELIMG